MLPGLGNVFSENSEHLSLPTDEAVSSLTQYLLDFWTYT